MWMLKYMYNLTNPILIKIVSMLAMVHPIHAIVSKILQEKNEN